ncbi:hypothetical protein [Roseiconus lacunae]|uniref:Phage head-tail joining protein domain-containing protein n=1 Tax=Roseiconus lacunae TaxID=2605694 RepID=A0ABT7PDQ9_9BACT|nr:hypothetical protein [Roseiconus lacunae]MDM4014632.1 hypothetical protein [Roseiconus lacunae]
MNLIQDALSIHAADIETAASETVTYTRDGSSIEGVIAVRGRSEFEEVSSEGEIHVQTRMTDWLIRAQLLKLDGQPIEPKRGDKITTSNGQSFEVFPGPDGEHWRWREAHQHAYRIHTVRRSVQSE